MNGWNVLSASNETTAFGLALGFTGSSSTGLTVENTVVKSSKSRLAGVDEVAQIELPLLVA